MWPSLIFCGTAGLFVLSMISALWHLRWVRRLPGLDALSQAPASDPVRCSVVIAARDEEGRIQETLGRLLAQRNVALEIIVVDDRSADRTGEIVRRIAAADARVRLVRVEVLPSGWLGKCHACHLGANAATGEWILFTDADCWLSADVLTRALRAAARARADHVTLVAGLAACSHMRKTAHLLFLLSVSDWISGVNRDRTGAHFGMGAFNLVRADAYRECGGYEALRLTVIDDIRLGLLLHRTGKRTRAFLGGDDVECHWGATAWELVKIMEKNYFAAVDFRMGVVLAGGAFALAVFVVLGWGLLSGTAAGLAAALSPLLPIVPMCVLARRVGWCTLHTLLLPAIVPLFLYMVFRSAFLTTRRGGVRWRETFYPLAELRAQGVR